MARLIAETNQAGNTLHGGQAKHLINVVGVLQADWASVAFNLVSVDGDQGFPGKLNVSVRYELTEDNQGFCEYKQHR